ncbi:uncharacterized protein TRIVIDRAFT_77999 [Trichoderma virens Gv29-8]|uniref:Uncharacterized protein n=1 Tax=Hypocrea virens (strain Gv29-8 / FGSC 10586) TaxID=413071 RepID=G9MXF6_HYPVG|nr:uncharacterized protein TRIVIDRAFT_77999 [Trichoderma virens Gv29-8]EHK20854.1 hypothetical protein TRIVIDRAFT_77999 [Trichoderma virens Gv29-8]UKZ56879.1 hypothetical protein TrVGV298_010724 [Trichoderma virens]
MSSSTYTLFDIPTKAPQVCWSMNIWRTRLLLNYKGLDYKTEWVEYPDIGPRLIQHVPPNERGPKFTLPAIQMPDDSYVMDSYKIADIIEEKYPEPKVLLNTPVQARFRNSMIKFMEELTPIYVPGVAQKILGEESLDFFHTTRQEDVGMPLYDYGKQNSPGAFERAEPFAREITALLNETSGPYFLGDTVSYADFMWAGILLFFKCLGTEEYQQVLKGTGDAAAHTRFLDALSPWTEKND